MNWKEIEQKLPSMTQAQLIESLKMCLGLIERMEGELLDGARKLDEMSALVHKLSKERSGDKQT